MYRPVVWRRPLLLVLLSISLVWNVASSATAHQRRDLRLDRARETTARKSENIVGGDRSNGHENSGLLNILVVPHSHDDVGWEKTITDYYESEVKYIYETVTQALAADAKRKFNVVEMAFFSRWWNTDASSEDKAQWAKFVKNGQIEFLTAGWVMQDDAVSSYSANIDQLTIGHQFINELFGVKPRVGWMIDPFGLSSQTATHYAMSGFNAHVFARIPYDIKYHMQETQTLEFVWRGSSNNFGDKWDLFSHALDQSAYTSRAGFNFDNGDPPVGPDNIAELASLLVSDVQWRMTCFRIKEINHFLWLWGGDFEFQNATLMFDNMDQIMEYINQHPEKFNATIRYATVSEYVQIVNDLELSWNVYEDDFFPLSTNSSFWHAHTKWGDQGLGYWTGFFSSRSKLKGAVRAADNVLRTAEMQYALNANMYYISNNSQSVQAIDSLRKAAAECAHHDGVTGTSSPDVVQMYLNDLQTSTTGVQPLLVQSIQTLILHNETTKAQDLPPLSDNFNNMLKLLHSLNDPSQSVPIVLYNNLGWKQCRYVNVPSPRKDLKVVGPENVVVASQVNPSSSANSPMPYTLFFYACIPPMGYQTYFIGISSSSEEPASPVKVTRRKILLEDNDENLDSDYTIQNGVYQLTFSSSTGLLKSVEYLNGESILVAFDQELAAYDSFDYYDKKIGSPSGAYIFHPVGNATGIQQASFQINVVTGPYVQEVTQVFDNTHSQVVRLYVAPKNDGDENIADVENVIEMLVSVGPLAGDKEVITRFNTSIASGKTFFTDGNGLETRQRTYNKNKPLNIPGNYFPAVMHSSIRDDTTQLTAMFDRSHGVSSQVSGQLEVMLHRRLVQGDGMGPMDNDLDRLVDVTTWILVNSPQRSAQLRPPLTQMLQYPPTLFYGTSVTTADKWTSIYSTKFTPLKESFPANVHLLSFKSQYDLQYQNANDAILLRVLHMYETNADPILSTNVTFDLQDIFSSSISQLEERSLTTVWSPSEMERLQWKTNNYYENHNDKETNRSRGSAARTKMTTTTIALSPMEIRTYFVQFSNDKNDS